MAALKENYKTSSAGTVFVDDPKSKKKDKKKEVGVHHEAMLGHDDNLVEALTRPAPRSGGAPAVARARP